MPTITPPMLL